MKIQFLTILFLIAIFACETQKDVKGKKEVEVKKKSQSDLIISGKKKRTIGEVIPIEIVPSSEENVIDSVQVFANNFFLTTIATPPFNYELNTTPMPVGETSIRAIAYFQDGSKDIDHTSVILLSDITPIQYDYRIRQNYPHDRKAFTQGLTFHNGYMYEGTGQKGESNIRKVDLKTGEVLQTKYIPSQYFGEGITIYNNKLYQLTWRSRKGFIYDLETFDQIREFTYHTEGWGLTNMGDTLVMSDGSATLYLLNAETLSEIGRIKVYNQDRAINDLNELEYINGEIHANVYQKDEIVIINPKNGKVTGVINLAGLFDLNMNHRDIDVLNGIAYDPQTGRYFVTGKNWTQLFEIELIRREPVAQAE